MVIVSSKFTHGCIFLFLLFWSFGQKILCRSTIVKKIALPEQKRLTHLLDQAETTPTITIWIHGTSMFVPSIFKDLFNRTPSLKKITDSQEFLPFYQVATLLCTTKSSPFCLNDFYIFGWSGKLSFNTREESAEKLYQEIDTLINYYKHEKKVTPKIKIIAHSHGGNVALNMASLHDSTKNNFVIDELILLACPVQTSTQHYVKSSLFTKIYSLYSHLDFIQILDPQGIYAKYHRGDFFFSQRCFAPEEKIAQVKMKINGRAILHSEFISSRFLTLLPHIIQEIDNWKGEYAHTTDHWSNTKKLLCVYTNNRTVRPAHYAAYNKKLLYHRAKKTSYALTTRC